MERRRRSTKRRRGRRRRRSESKRKKKKKKNEVCRHTIKQPMHDKISKYILDKHPQSVNKLTMFFAKIYPTTSIVKYGFSTISM